MQKFTRNLTREITLAGERLALTLSEEGLQVRAVGTRRPPLQLSWGAALVAASRTTSEPSQDEVASVVQTMVPTGRKMESGSPAPAPAAVGADSTANTPS